MKNYIDEHLACAIECKKCATYCMGHADRDLLRCVALCYDCSDICSLCAQFEARGSTFAGELNVISIDLCKACAMECMKHQATYDCCRKCAEACLKFVEISTAA